MRKVILSIQVPFDGFIEGPNGELDWLVAHVVNEDAWQYFKLRGVNSSAISELMHSRRRNTAGGLKTDRL